MWHSNTFQSDLIVLALMHPHGRRGKAGAVRLSVLLFLGIDAVSVEDWAQ